MMAYLNRYFIGADEMQVRTKMSGKQRMALEEAGCAPGAIYRTWRSGAVWSRLGNTQLAGQCEDDASAKEWFSPASVWWLRMASAIGRGPSDAALALQQRFVDAFASAAQVEPDASLAFANIFAGDSLDVGVATRHALHEWKSWSEGGYGVCLRRFSAQAVFTKMVARAKIERLLHDANASAIDLLEQVARLEAVLLPFSPLERARGTPGWAIDAALTSLGVGHEPWAVANAAGVSLQDESHNGRAEGSLF
jgi:hypothetical protein